MTIRRLFSGIKQRLFKIAANLTKKEVAVLMFHEVCDRQNSFDDSLSISFDNFKKTIECVLKSRNIVKIEKLGCSSEPIAIVTFDDVFANIFDDAIPFLIENHIPFTLFICEEFVDRAGYVSSKQIEIIRDNPLCSICFHSKHHIFLSKVEKDTFAEEVNPKEFEQKYSVRCTQFAFPYGSIYSSYCKNRSYLPNFYEFGFSSIDSCFSFKYLIRHKYFLPRLNVCNDTYKTIIKKSSIKPSTRS